MILLSLHPSPASETSAFNRCDKKTTPFPICQNASTTMLHQYTLIGRKL
jgi:hypothetical protein